MGRVVKSVSLPTEMAEVVEKNIPEFSTYVQACIERDFADEFLEKKIQDHQKEILRLQALKNISEKKPVKENKEEMKFIEWVKENIKKNPGEIHENRRVFNLKFGKNINIKKFKELVNGPK